jgi:hypothetical protein
MSVADDGPKATPAEPLYDVLPSPNAQPGGMNYSGSLPAATIAAARAD